LISHLTEAVTFLIFVSKPIATLPGCSITDTPSFRSAQITLGMLRQTIDPLVREQQEIEKRRQRLEERRQRVLDVKTRTIGVSGDGLDDV